MIMKLLDVPRRGTECLRWQLCENMMMVRRYDTLWYDDDIGRAWNGVMEAREV